MDDRFRTARSQISGLDWEDVRFFAALTRHGSLSATARALSVNHATVARRIAALEQTLGARLFKRRPTGYDLTAAGRRALQAADVMESAASALSRLPPEQALTGLVRITATPSLAETFLIPRLARLQQQHPELDLEIVAERRPLSLQRYQSDIALRLGRPEGGELIGRRVARVAYRFYATPAWRNLLKQGGRPCFIGFDEAGSQFPEALWLARSFSDLRLALRCNNQSGQVVAARAGCGIALLPRFLAAGDPALVELTLPHAPPMRELWLLSRRDRQRTPRIRVVVDFLLDLILREKALFEGE
jgi:DNA-binding transcriptional LysR family regulator